MYKLCSTNRKREWYSVNGRAYKYLKLTNKSIEDTMKGVADVNAKQAWQITSKTSKKYISVYWRATPILLMAANH